MTRGISLQDTVLPTSILLLMLIALIWTVLFKCIYNSWSKSVNTSLHTTDQILKCLFVHGSEA